MKVVFVQPRYFNIWEALGFAYIGAYAKRHFHGKLEIEFFEGYFDKDEVIIEKGKSADIVAFSCTSPTFGHAVGLARMIKSLNPGVRTVFGGFHPSAVPQDCLMEEAVDQVVVREGEDAFLAILNGNTSSIVTGKPLEEFGDLFPDRELIKNIRTVDLCERMSGLRITSFQSVRVCPFQCTFCAEKVITGKQNKSSNPLRVRGAEHLLQEIQSVASRYNLGFFKFADATWNTSAEKVIEFCEEKILQNCSLPWEANIHASLASKEMLVAMKAANCRQINVGCESGSPAILKDQKKGLKVERIKKVFKWAREVGIDRRAYFLLGMPNETAADIRLTEKLVEDIDPEVFGTTILAPYPGVAMYNPVEMKDYDWAFADEYSNPYWKTKNFSNQELKEWQRYLLKKFPNKSSWHNRVLAGGDDIDYTKLEINFD